MLKKKTKTTIKISEKKVEERRKWERKLRWNMSIKFFLKIKSKHVAPMVSKAAPIYSFVSWYVIYYIVYPFHLFHFQSKKNFYNETWWRENFLKRSEDFVNGTVIFHIDKFLSGFSSFFMWTKIERESFFKSDSSACKAVDKITLLDSLHHSTKCELFSYL